MKNNSLEALRAFSAIYVFLHHTLYTFNLLEQGSLFWYLFLFGQEAVIIFFILSGYVIGLSLEKNEYSFKTYFIHRFTRIYTVIVFSYLISYLCWLTYSNDVLPSFTDFIFNIFMLQDKGSSHIGNFAEPLFNNQPLWSLGFEWWFYMLFFFHFYLIKNKTINYKLLSTFLISLFGIISFYFYNNQISTFLMYYFVWFSGVVFVFKGVKRKIYIKYLTISFILIAFYYLIYLHNVEYTKSYIYPWITFRHFLGFFGILVSFIVLQKVLILLVENNIIKKIVKPFIYIASFSYAIYIIHYPIMNAINELEINSLNKFLFTSTLTLLLSYLRATCRFPQTTNNLS